MPASDNKLPDPFSKSKLKREMEALQKIGKELIDLPANQLAKIDVPDTLLNAIHLAHTLKTHEAKRRHLQYIGKLMRTIDSAAIKIELEKIKLSNAMQTKGFHKIEECRDQLITEGDPALQKLLAEYPQADRQQLRQLIRKAQYDRAHNKNSGAETELFRCLRELFESNT